MCWWCDLTPTCRLCLPCTFLLQPHGGSVMPCFKSSNLPTDTAHLGAACVSVCGWTVTWVVPEVSLWWLIYPEMTNSHTPQWTVMTAIRARVWLWKTYLYSLSVESFIGRERARDRSQNFGYFVKNKTVMFLFAQHSCTAPLIWR